MVRRNTTHAEEGRVAARYDKAAPQCHMRGCKNDLARLSSTHKGSRSDLGYDHRKMGAVDAAAGAADVVDDP